MKGPWTPTLIAVAAAVSTASGAAARVDPKFDLEPTARQFSMYYPVRALDLSRGGQAVLDCVVQPDATLGGCAIVSETPQGLGFGAAGLHLSRLYRMKIGAPPAGGHIQLPIDFHTTAVR